MPNWTANQISAEGEEVDLRAFLEAVRSDYGAFDFNTVIPMPEILKNTASGSRDFDGIRHNAWYSSRAKKSLTDTSTDRPFTDEEQAELQEDWLQQLVRVGLRALGHEMERHRRQGRR